MLLLALEIKSVRGLRADRNSLSSTRSRGKEDIILRDTNCDDDSEEDKNKMVKLLRYQIKQLITSATRKTKNTRSIIDHFATNRPDVITKTGTAEIGFCDHDIIYGMRKISGPKQNIEILRMTGEVNPQS